MKILGKMLTVVNARGPDMCYLYTQWRDDCLFLNSQHALITNIIISVTVWAVLHTFFLTLWLCFDVFPARVQGHSRPF